MIGVYYSARTMAENYGRRLMVRILDDEARANPSRPFASVAKSAHLIDGFYEVTFKQMKAAVDQLVHLLQAEYGILSHNATISYIGIPDLRYNILCYAAWKCRLKASLYLEIACAYMLKRTRFFFLPQKIHQATMHHYSPRPIVQDWYILPRWAPIAQELKDAPETLLCFQLPALDEFLAAEPIPVPYDVESEQVKREPILILHSSGSTGLPKPVTMTHGSFAVFDNDRNFPKANGRINSDLTTWDFKPAGGKLYVPFPPFHIAGFYNSVMVPLYTKTVPVFGPPLRLPSGNLVAEILRQQDVRGCLLPPTTTAELFHEPDGPQLLRNLSVLCFGGGPLNEAIGNELAKHVTLCQFYGSTETGQARQLVPLEDDWQYIEFHPDSNQEMQPAEDDAYELVLYADEHTEDSSAINHNFPGLREFHTKDLFKPHPEKPRLWKFHARQDDIIVLSNGHKLNPILLETGLIRTAGVSGALLVGQGQPRVGLLVELRQDHELGPDPVESLWPTLVQLNDQMPTYGRVSKSMILIATVEKPFVRAAKGTVIRKLTVPAYEEELKRLFEDGLHLATRAYTLRPTVFRSEDAEKLLRSVVQDVLGQKEVNDEDALYVQGLDSVKSLEVIDTLKASLMSHTSSGLTWFSQRVLYSFPTIKELSPVLVEWLNAGVTPQEGDGIAMVRKTLDHFRAFLPIQSGSPLLSPDPDANFNVVLVGSTGYLGRFLLAALRQNSKVDQIFCLNRSAEAAHQWESFAAQQDSRMATKPVTFFQADFTRPAFGLNSHDYEKLKSRCNVIIHSAWQVNFVIPLSVFTDSFQGLLSSITLAASTKYRSRLLFVYSIAATGVFGKPGSPRQTVPEMTLDALGASIGTGYGDSKLIAELLLSAATSVSGISASILRVGQIAPSSKQDGAIWPSMDSVKALLLTSRMLSKVPFDLMEVDWLPVDATVDIINDVMLYDSIGVEKSKLSVYNLMNPSSVPWSDLIHPIQKWCGGVATYTSFREWLDSTSSLGKDRDLQQPPALQLLPFYELLAKRGEIHEYDQERLLQISSTACNVKAIDRKLLENWLAVL